MDNFEGTPTQDENAAKLNRIYERIIKEVLTYTNLGQLPPEKKEAEKENVRKIIEIFLSIDPKADDERLFKAVSEMLFEVTAIKSGAEQPTTKLN